MLEPATHGSNQLCKALRRRYSECRPNLHTLQPVEQFRDCESIGLAGSSLDELLALTPNLPRSELVPHELQHLLEDLCAFTLGIVDGLNGMSADNAFACNSTDCDMGAGNILFLPRLLVS
ncbi:MAG: hypothetical protein M3Y41_02680 [Pseudomonadota bacterium]|nr:hypothetical protein [Pseudomonadota bacterium]